MRRSLFVKNFIIYALVIVVSFTILGGAFVYQINQFSLEEKADVLNATAQHAAQSTAFYLKAAGNGDLLERLDTESVYRYNMMLLAQDLQGMIFVANIDGRLMYIATPDGCYAQEQGAVPKAAVESVLEKGSYSEVGNFSGYLRSAHFISGVPIGKTEQALGAVFVALTADNSLVFFFDITSTFLLMIVVVLLITLAVTYLVVRSTVKPLQQMAAAAKGFARGDFSVRVPLPDHKDELYDVVHSFNNMANSVENMESMRRGLIANVSHDLRTPMTTIAGFVDGILDGTIPQDRQSYYLHIISEEVKRLSRLASSMLQVSRLESGEMGLSKTLFDFSEMVRRIIIGFEQKLNDKKIELELDAPDSLNISADHDGIFQAVYNLFDNAVKFVDEGGQIQIYMAVKAGKLQFHIVNTGSEIKPESVKHIFDRFYKEDTSRGVNKTGSGLGLYIVKTVVNKHGGDVHAMSADGKTEFCFEIPV